jgi:hypothetical protein
MNYDFIELQQCCINYPSSHWEEMNTKGLTMDQILTVKKDATTAPQLSRAVICRNMLLHNSPTKEITPDHARTVQRRVYAVLKELTQNFGVRNSSAVLLLMIHLGR